MHILIITPGFPKDENDSSCIPPMQEYLETLLRSYEGIKVSVVSIHYPGKRTNYSWKKLKVYAIGGKRRKQPIRSLFWLKAILKSCEINREEKVDILHSFWLNESALIGEVVSRLLHIQHINTMMGQDAKKNNKYLKLLPLKRITKVAVSEFQAGVFKQSASFNVDAIIPWGINSFALNNCEREIDILGVGSLIEIKNFDSFIEVIGELRNEFRKIKCMILGEGHLRNLLLDKINSYKLQDNIKLPGQVAREKVLSYMNKSKILFHTSDYESFGYVLEEALAAGCYVVSRKIGCAEQSDKFFIGESTEEFIRLVKVILLNKINYIPRILFPISGTAASYMSVYEKYLQPSAATKQKQIATVNYNQRGI
jgi:1,2-diacylglycerol 3-alpha-glucosyltransferase